MRNVLLLLVTLVCLPILAAWLQPFVAQQLPDGWALMKFNTALCMLLIVLSFVLSRPGQGERQLWCSRLLAAVVAVLAGSALFEHLSGIVTGLDTVFVADASAANPGRMSLQTAMYLTILGLVTVFARARKNATSRLIDLLALLLLLLVLVILAGYCFGASNLFGQSAYTRTSPQTLFCMVLLMLVAMGRRAEYGYYAVLVGVGIGSRVSRLMLPVAVIVPFLLVIVGAYSTLAGWLSAPYAAALTAATTSTLFFCMVIILAWRINDLERDLRDMSLTDELTQIYNRRGFQLLGEQAWLEAQRASSPLSVLYFDLDGLKLANDTHGHEVGSQFVRDMAVLLKSIFRGADIVARVGGDEFAVVAHTDLTGTRAAMSRLEAAVAILDQAEGRLYRIRFSVGEAFCDLAAAETFSAVVNRADALMYERKRAKQAR